jgi:hypothetical protein
MRIRYAVMLHGRICRIVGSLKEAIGSMAYHPSRGGQIFEIEYNSLDIPIDARLI